LSSAGPACLGEGRRHIDQTQASLLRKSGRAHRLRLKNARGKKSNEQRVRKSAAHLLGAQQTQPRKRDRRGLKQKKKKKKKKATCSSPKKMAAQKQRAEITGVVKRPRKETGGPQEGY